MAVIPTTNKPTILHLGDPVKYNNELYKQFSSQYLVVRPSEEERGREEFISALKHRKWGDFNAIFRPHWNTGGEMGRWDAELISLLPKSVKVFASAGAGFDWVDVDVLAENGILYCNGASPESSEAVADTAIFHILSVFRNFTWSHLAARSCDSERFLDAHLNATATSRNPRGHVLGVIGFGNIGYIIAQKAYAAFGMKICYNDIVRKPGDKESAIEATFYEDLDMMLGISDCVVVAILFSGEKLLNAERLKNFRRGSRLVNIARGKLVDEDAIIAALESGEIFAAGLDVHENEPHVSPVLAKMQNVTLTSHNGGGALETNFGFERLGMENIQLVLLGKDALTPVNQHFCK